MTEIRGVDGIRARSFGAVAADYDKYRPRYPDQLVDDVVTAVPGRRILEIGAGTGIATAAFTARGLAMTCVEPDEEMAATLRAKLTAVEDLQVEVATFEQWSAARPAGAPRFDGLVSAQAWHWIDPQTRWADAGAAVRKGGVIALFWNQDHFADPRVANAFVDAYDRRDIEIRSVHQEPAGLPDAGDIVDEGRPHGWPDFEAEANEYFTDLRTRRYRWTRQMSVTDYLARINTTSAHLILPAEVRGEMTTELITTLTTYGDTIELAMSTDLATAIRR